MKVYRLDPVGSIDNLKLGDEAECQPGLHQVVLRIRAVSLNYRDIMIATGSYNRSSIQPRPIPVSDGAGEVIAVGPGVTRAKVGDRVAAIFMQRWLGGQIDPAYALSALGGPAHGVLAERVVLSEEGVVAIPEHLSFEEAATLPCAAVTAWQALFSRGRLAPGETVLTLGTGGVSLFAAQFARLAGARVIITSGSEAKVDRLHAMGYEEVINYRARPEWAVEVLALTGGRGVDHVIEVGGGGTFRHSLAALRTGGRIYSIGGLAGEAQISPQAILAKRASVHGINVGSREMFEAMNRAISLAQLRPVIDRQFDFGDAQAAYHHLASGTHFGKIVIKGA